MSGFITRFVRERDFSEYRDITLYDRAAKKLIALPYPKQEGGPPILPSGIQAWCERRGLQWECDCAAFEERTCPVRFTGYLKSVAMCGSDPAKCGLHIDFKVIKLTATSYSFYPDIRTLASLEIEFNRPPRPIRRAGFEYRDGTMRTGRRYSDAYRQEFHPYAKTQRRRSALTYTAPPPSNQLALYDGRRSSPVSSPSSVRSSSVCSTATHMSASSSRSQTCNVLFRLERGDPITDWQYLDLVRRCDVCGRNFLPRFFEEHKRYCTGSIIDEEDEGQSSDW